MVEKISESLLNIIKEGESYTTELKEATTNLPKSLFESICGRLNRNGGHIFLGVTDNREIIGVDIEPFYARLIIEKDVLRTENANKARMIGDILQEKNLALNLKILKLQWYFVK